MEAQSAAVDREMAQLCGIDPGGPDWATLERTCLRRTITKESDSGKLGLADNNDPGASMAESVASTADEGGRVKRDRGQHRHYHFRTAWGTVQTQEYKRASKELLAQSVPQEKLPLLFAHQPLKADCYVLKEDSVPSVLTARPAPGQSLQGFQATQTRQDDDDDYDEYDMDVGSDNDTMIANGTTVVRETERSQSLATEAKPATKLASGVAMARPITADLNDVDQVIVDMKLAQYTDKSIATKLRESGAADYTEKTIGTRWKRIRTKLAERREMELEAGFNDWSFDHDQKLLKAVDEGEKAVQKLKDEAEAQKWNLVGQSLRAIDMRADYSSKACHERFAALENGTAVIPSEIDDDPEQRTTEMANRKAEWEWAQVQAQQDKEIEQRQKKDDYNRVSREKAQKRRAQEKKDREAMLRGEEVNSQESTPLPGQDTRQISVAPSVATSAAISAATGDHESGCPKDISLLGRKAKLALRAGQMENNVTEFVDDGKLEPVDKMTREKIRAELRTRGHKRNGMKEELAKHLAKARAGVGVTASYLPAYASSFEELADQKAKRKLPSAASQTKAAGGSLRHAEANLSKRRKLTKTTTVATEEGSVSAASTPMGNDGSDDNWDEATIRASDYSLRNRGGVGGSSIYREEDSDEFGINEPVTSGPEEQDDDFSE